jgi:ribonuclease P protein component
VIKLKTRAQFQEALYCKPVGHTPHFGMHVLTNPEPGFRLGAMVPKRWAKRAVTRNLIKRQIYNIGQSQITPPAHHTFLVRLRQRFDLDQFPSASSRDLQRLVRLELQQLFQNWWAQQLKSDAKEAFQATQATQANQAP